MAAQKKKTKEINLLPQEQFATTTTGRVLAWVLSTFRLIVVLTEMVVIIAFRSRFWLDIRSSDLTDEVENQKEIVESYSNFEKVFRQTQKKLGVFSQFSANPAQFDLVKNYITPYLPSDVFLKSITLTYSEVRIQGSSFTEQSIAQLISNLNSAGKLKDVKLTQVSSKNESPFIEFSISSILNEGGTI